MLKNKYFRRIQYSTVMTFLIIEGIACFFIKLILFVFLFIMLPVYYFYQPMWPIDIAAAVEEYESELTERLEFYGKKLAETK